MTRLFPEEGRGALDLPALLGRVRARALAALPPEWPALREMVDSHLPDPMDPHVSLPIATALAVGASPGECVPFAASWALIALAVRILDDCIDQDNPQALSQTVGLGRAINAGSGLLLHATAMLRRLPFPVRRVHLMLDEYWEMAVTVHAGQDDDIASRVTTLEQYEQLVERKTIGPFGFAAAGGAMMHTDDFRAVDACRRCGRAVGYLLQVLDDVEALWFPDGPSDLELGKLTYPVLLGLAREPAPQGALRALLADRPLDLVRIRGALDALALRQHLVEEALRARDEALSHLPAGSDTPAARVLSAWLDHIFRGVSALLPRKPG